MNTTIRYAESDGTSDDGAVKLVDIDDDDNSDDDDAIDAEVASGGGLDANVVDSDCSEGCGSGSEDDIDGEEATEATAAATAEAV